jgi:signal transduction histidine kinase
MPAPALPGRHKTYVEACFSAPWFYQLAGVLLWNSMVTVLLVVGFGNEDIFRTWVYANLIGLLIWAENIAIGSIAHAIGRELPGWGYAALTVVTVPTGLFGGQMLGDLFWREPVAVPDLNASRTSLVFTLMVTMIGVMFFWIRARAANVKTEAAERAEALEAQERRATEAHLKLLQTQLEPHFLFNTLGVLDSMIATEPDQARALLQALNTYLRAALSATRAPADGHTLGNEVGLVESYLKIMQMRFGDRLDYHIEVDDSARALAFPTMLLQPLVENAIRHGVEPSKTGGSIGVEAHVIVEGDAERLLVRVSDTGVGLSDAPSTKGTGAGLSNIRERLAALFGNTARITLEENPPHGVVAQLSLPCKPCRSH